MYYQRPPGKKVVEVCLENILVLSIVIFLVKVAFFLFLFIWLRATMMT